MKFKNKKLIRNLVLIVGILAILFFGTIFIHQTMTANVIRERKELARYQTWLAENCECLVRERRFCREGFELSGRLCRAEGKVTNPFLACSKYDCSGEIKIWNNETEMWGDWIDE